MKVAIDASALGSGKGGDETYVRGLLTGLATCADQDFRFVVFLAPGGSPPDPIIENELFEIRWLSDRSPLRRYILELPRALSRGKRVDLLHTQIHAPIRSPVPCALLVPDLSFRHFPQFYRPATRLRLNLLVPLHMRQARIVVTVSEYSRRDLIETYGLAGDRVVVIPNVVAKQPDPGAAEDEAMSRLRSRGAAEPYFLYVGNLHPRKNLGRLIKAFERARLREPGLAGHRLVIAGAPWRWGADVRGGQDAGTVLLGPITELERVALMRRAVALAYPSLFEGFGLPPLEALALGTPVLASNTSSMPEVLGNAALLVDPLDVGAISDGLSQLAGDRALRDRLRAAGPAQAARYVPEAAGRAGIAAFEKAIHMRSAG